MNGWASRRMGSWIVIPVLVAAAGGGCQALEPSPTPHPAIVRFVTRSGPDEIALVDPGRLEGLPIGQDEAIRRGTAGMDPATAGGLTVAWGVQLATGMGVRSGWIVMRGDPRDAELSGSVFALELVVIDALTGQPLQWARPAVPPRDVPPASGFEN